MRTSALLSEYLRDPTYVTPSYGWERLVWHAADLVRMAHTLRNTSRATKIRKSKFIQEELNLERR